MTKAIVLLRDYFMNIVMLFVYHLQIALRRGNSAYETAIFYGGDHITS